MVTKQTVKQTSGGYAASLISAVRNYGEAWGGIVTGGGLTNAVIGAAGTSNPVFETVRAKVGSGDAITIAGFPDRVIHITGVGWNYLNQSVDAAYGYVSTGLQGQSPMFTLAPGKSVTMDGLRVTMDSVQGHAFTIFGDNSSVLTAHAHIVVENLQNLGPSLLATGAAIAVLGASIVLASRHLKKSDGTLANAKGQ